MSISGKSIFFNPVMISATLLGRRGRARQVANANPTSGFQLFQEMYRTHIHRSRHRMTHLERAMFHHRPVRLAASVGRSPLGEIVNILAGYRGTLFSLSVPEGRLTLVSYRPFDGIKNAAEGHRPAEKP